VNPTIRLFRLKPLEENHPISFKPGQWLDVYVPGIPKAGGFTITSPPSILTSSSPYLELAVQESPSNPPAAWLWKPKEEILGQELGVRVGGSFYWPPEALKEGRVGRAVFVAGGVGINPLMSIISNLAGEKKAKGRLGFQVRFLYTTRDPGVGRGLSEVLFLERLRDNFEVLGDEGELKLFLTRSTGSLDGDGAFVNGGALTMEKRRINKEDLLEALGPVGERGNTVCYICGVPTMTDEFVDITQFADGMVKGNVICEKWW
jgi:NAD(P)H-flavin reductase